MKLTSTPYDFVVSAQPHAWFLTADNLHEQSVLLYNDKGKNKLTLRSRYSVEQVWDTSDRTAFLLSGFALENLIKGFLVYENPEWISNGSLSRKLLSHDLNKIRSYSMLIPLKSKYKNVLNIFSEGIETWARYPCATNSNRTSPLPNYSTDIWDRYNFLISAYSRRLIKLLEKDWVGPHGFKARYEIHGSFFCKNW